MLSVYPMNSPIQMMQIFVEIKITSDDRILRLLVTREI